MKLLISVATPVASQFSSHFVNCYS